ncbi:MAG: ABC transporter permease [Verrucomicrobiales bacterium]|jgi:putative ABC transport system permease protein|nr:ABC transporter permease [Verrucomicrobiales bacterium]MDB4467958.1 ABC transporter permease [Verrucomicrobiales bacterium]MDF1786982.1 ABC transporter permease [Verrucomicrobiales bacterium]NCF85585.1 FtsX-like permease family protein [Verrucomicrobiaceae bacterium]
MVSSLLLNTVQLGVKSLMLHKLRSGLTMLGIIFGVCSVIAMLAIGEGASYEAQERIKRLGSTNVIINSFKPPEENDDSGSNRSSEIDYGLTYEDAARLQTTIPNVGDVVPMRIIRENIRFGRNQVSGQVIGTLSAYPKVQGLDIVRGRFLSEMDDKHQRNVCVITKGLAQRLFPYQDPLVNTVRIQSVYYEVIGMVQETGTIDQRPKKGEAEGDPIDNNVYIPLSTARARFGETIVRRSSGGFSAERVELHRIIAKLNDTESVLTAEPQIKQLLKRFHEKNDYELIVPLQLLMEAEATKRMFNIVLGSIAAISLLVGGIGIMNIMLATVTERTREIGVRRALGAKKKDIITQFLIETIVLSVGGGLIGVVIGIATPLLVSYFTSMMTVITLWSVLLAFGISGLTGIVFGLYPASQAAKLDPIEALRHE